MAKLVITAESGGKRLDKFISESPQSISRSYAANLCAAGRVLVNGVSREKKYKLSEGDVIEIDVPEPEPSEIIPEDIPLDIVYEDNDVIVINKPRGMVVHPAIGNPSGTLVNALAYHCGDNLSAINGVLRPGVVHRIDKNTTGLLMAAKNNEAHLKLSEQLKERKALRKYRALVHGNIKEDELTVNKPLARNPSDRKRMAVVAGGKEAVTHVKVLERFGAYTYIECILETGRTHQIRVHMSSIGHPIVGDSVYGVKKENFKTEGQLLHAKTIGFKHPKTGELMTFDSELPEDFQSILDKLRSIYS